MRKRLWRTSLLVTVAAFLAGAPLESQDWRGRARVDGWVKDASGQPVVDAQVQLSRDTKGGGPVSKTNKKGYWSVMGLIGGTWNVDISAPGFETRKLAVTLSEAARIPPIEVKLDKAAAAPAAAGEGVQTGGAGPEIIAAIQEGNRLLGEKKYAEARALYEKALAAVPDNPAILKGIAQTYAGEGNKTKSVETLKKVTELDPSDTRAASSSRASCSSRATSTRARRCWRLCPRGPSRTPASTRTSGSCS